MRLSEAGEFAFLRLVQDDLEAKAGSVLVGIGDDAAVLAGPGADSLVLTCDAAVDGRHFQRRWFTGTQIGGRAVGAALSDLAAMGARPVAVLLTLLIAPDEDVEFARAIVKGAAEAAEELGALLVGGETVSTDGPLSLDVMAAGFVSAGRELRRSAARPGDALVVSGTLGDSAAGLAALTAELAEGQAVEQVIGRYKKPQARVALGLVLAESGAVRAAIDISDGLLRDAGHLAEQSGVAVVIERDAIPVSPGCRDIARQLSRDPYEWAMGGGEDFELLFSAAPGQLEALVSHVQSDLGLPITRIGTVVEGEGVSVRLPDGTQIEPHSSGWDQFSRE